MENLWKDLRYAIRMLIKTPGFALVAILALGLGIGANTAIFSVFDGMLWRPLPVQDAKRLVVVADKDRSVQFALNLSYPDVQDYRQLKSVFTDLAAYSPSAVSFSVDGRPERAWVDMVTGNYFSMLGIKPARGRTFAADEGWIPGKDSVIVLSYKYWQRRFAGSDSVIGKSVQVNQHPFTIIGVAPADYQGAYYFLDPDFYLSVSTLPVISPGQPDVLTQRSASFLHVLGYLQPGVTPEQAMAAAAPTDQRLAHDFPDSHSNLSLLVIPELKARPEPGFGGYMSTVAGIFMSLVGLVLLISCANVANMILARANARRKEIATRAALGATRGRMIRQLLTESTLLALCGGLVGILFARWAALALMSIHVPSDIPVRFFDLRLDWKVFAFCFFAALLTGLVAGIVPSLQFSRANLSDVLKAGGRSGGSSAGHHRFRDALVVSQVAISLVLLAGAGFFVRSLLNSANADMGFRIDRTLMMSVDLGTQGYSADRGQQFYNQLAERVRTLPGVKDAAVGADVPMGFTANNASIFPDGQPIDEKSKSETAFYDSVQPGYFRAIGTPITAGREFTAADTATSPGVAVVNEAFAKKIWPGEDPIGKRFRVDKTGPAIQVVGLTRTGKYLFLYETPQLYAYFPLSQNYNSSATLFVNSQSADPQSLTQPIREQIRQLDSALPVYDINTMQTHVQLGKPLLPARLGAMLVGAFGLLGLILASVGVYGVVSYSVSQRTQEIGIRTALGAQHRNVLALVLRQGMGMAAIGTAIGAGLALLLFRGLHTLLYGVQSTDLTTLAAVSTLLLTVAFAATYIPAWRATQVDPVTALRQD
ncbi:MAG TPA: ABC transporter permease [Candidatus Acidoferrum sp.]|jgi:predicted permease